MALEHKARGRKATGAKAAALRTRLSGERRDVKVAVAVQLREAEKKLQSAQGRAHEAEALLVLWMQANGANTSPFEQTRSHLKKYKTLSTPPDSR
jgi:hypothetical protein